MNYEEMTLAELKEYAKQKGISVGNSGKEKLIEKIKEKELVNSVFNDDDLEESDDIEVSVEKGEKVTHDTSSLLSSISDAIDELDESADDDIQVGDVGLSLDDIIPVKSITFGGLTYKARSTNAIYRWPTIGSLEYMSISELNEMNNYKRAYLNKPLVILMDERAIKKFRLQKVYENVAQINNLKSLFKSDMSTIERTIDTALDANMRDILISKVRQMIKNGTLTNINIIKLLEKKLQHDLADIV